MKEYTNGQDLPLSVAAWLAHDSYVPNPDIISATQLIKPVRKLILEKRITAGPASIKIIAEPTEVMGMMKSRKGTAVHASIESVWLNEDTRISSLMSLGYPEASARKFVVNVEPENLKKGDYPVYVERFCEREHDSGFWVGGTADFVLRGRLSDFKNTSTYSYADADKDRQYQLQGSIYRWAMPDIVTEDEMDIVEMYDDWTKAQSFRANYPPHQVIVKRIPLLNIKATDRYIHNKINLILENLDLDERDIEPCSDADLWRRSDVYKYYQNPDATGRSSGNFDTYEEAAARKREKGGVGRIDKVKGKAVACRFCDARPICSQAKTLAANGELDL